MKNPSWYNEQFWENVSHVLFFMGAALALFSDNTNLLLFIIIAILLMRFN
jgi:hypothetical protein